MHRRTITGREKRLRLIVSRGGRKIPVSTDITILASDWSQTTQRVKASAPGATELNAALGKLRNEANALSIMHPDDDDLKNALLKRLGRMPKVYEATLLERFEEFKAHKASRVKASTMSTYAALEEHLISSPSWATHT